MSEIQSPPKYCQYVCAACDQDFSGLGEKSLFFIYPSEPQTISAAIEAASSGMGGAFHDAFTWKHLEVAGHIIFCEICKGMRESSTIVADVTTLNFNLMFEVGFAIGLGLPVVPIRDVSYERDKRAFEEIGVLDTLGYVNFQNSSDLISGLSERMPVSPLSAMTQRDFEQPLYLIKGKWESEGALNLMASLKKSALRFRTYDPNETQRISLGELRRQVFGSQGVITHLVSPHREGAKAHNALCALASGLAMAQQKAVLMLQEEAVTQPIDYRDVVKTYTHPSRIQGLVEPLIYEVVARIQSRREVTVSPEGVLEKLDFGDPAAENEIGGLKAYFVRTGQFTQAKQGHARLVVGRKGTGKTAIFYGVRDFARQSQFTTILDLKPEGHQFVRLRETVLTALSAGLQEHTMTAFWTFVLLTELARKIVYEEDRFAFRDPQMKQLFDAVKHEYGRYGMDLGQDFPQPALLEI